jgi:hypothetical protein
MTHYQETSWPHLASWANHPTSTEIDRFSQPWIFVDLHWGFPED